MEIHNCPTPPLKFLLHLLMIIIFASPVFCGRKKEGVSNWRPPSFDTNLPNNLTVLEGETAALTCVVSRLRGRSVSWIRQRDLHVISADNLIFTTDNRFQVKIDNSSSSWRLLVSPALRNDTGVYECQVNTRPKLSWSVTLNVRVPVARLEGPPELYIKSGSTLVLTCTATLHPDASSSVWWGHNGSSISITSPRGGVSIETEKEGRQILSRLSVVHALASDAGNYTCQPDLVTAANITVYVVEDEVPAAMAHDGGCRSTTTASWQIIFGATAFTTTILSKPANTAAPARCLLNVLVHIVLNYVWMITVLLPIVSNVFCRRIQTNDKDDCLCCQSHYFSDNGLKNKNSFDCSNTMLLDNTSERKPKQGIFVFMFHCDKNWELRSDGQSNIMKPNNLKDRRSNILEHKNQCHINECHAISCGNTSKKKLHSTIQCR